MEVVVEVAMISQGSENEVDVSGVAGVITEKVLLLNSNQQPVDIFRVGVHD